MKNWILYPAAALVGGVYLAVVTWGGLMWSVAGLAAAILWLAFFAREMRGLWALLLAAALGCAIGGWFYAGSGITELEAASAGLTMLVHLAVIAIAAGFMQKKK